MRGGDGGREGGRGAVGGHSGGCAVAWRLRATLDDGSSDGRAADVHVRVYVYVYAGWETATGRCGRGVVAGNGDLREGGQVAEFIHAGRSGLGQGARVYG